MLFTIEAAVSGIGYLTLALSVGTLLTAGFLLPANDSVLRRNLAAAARLFLFVFLIVGFLAVLVQGAKLSGGTWPSGDVLIRYLGRTQSGRIWLAREIYVVCLMALATALLRREVNVRALRLLFFLVLVLVATRGLTGHAVAARENAVLLIGADAIHMTCVTLWAGGLPVLFWMLLDQRTRQTHGSFYWVAESVKRFSRVAWVSVCLLMATGLYQALIHVQDLPTLLNTSYGNVLAFKLLLFGLMVAFGAVNFFSTRPALVQAASSAPARSRAARAYRPVGWEGALGVLVLMATGFLTSLPPGAHSAHSPPHPDNAAATSHVHAQPSARPLTAAEGASVRIIVPAPGQVFSGDRVPLEFLLIKGKRGHHAHAYVDGELAGMFETAKGTLTGIKPGEHTLEIRVVMEDHKTEIDATDRVTFAIE